MITIEPVSKQNASEIYKFENENRAFFESTLPSRGDDYYVPSNFENIIDSICEEQQAEVLYMNIIRNESNEMVGRINLFPIQTEPYNRAFELGYRIGEAHQGKGYASEAVKILTKLAFDTYGIDYIQALTSPNNIASQIILIKTGYVFIKRIPNDVEVNGAFEDSIVFESVR